MTAAPRLAWRQARGAWRHFVLLAACVALGVAALVAVGSFATTLDRTLAREAKALTGGDLELRAARPLDGDSAAALADLRARGAVIVGVRELVAMARGADGRALLVEAKAPDSGYPLYGRLQLAPAEPLPALLANDGAVVQRETLERLGLRPGDRLALGRATFTVRGIVEREPDRAASLVTLGPRVFIAGDALERTGLVQIGSRVRYRVLVRLPERLAARDTREALARRIADPGIRVASYDEAQPGLRRFFSQLLVGLASLLVGGIGVASSVATFVRRQAPTIAILKALGADSRTLLATFLWQTLTVGAVASVVGAGLGAALQPVLIRLLAGFVPFALDARVEPLTLARGVLMGVLTTLLCAMWPLLAVRDVRPSGTRVVEDLANTTARRLQAAGELLQSEHRASLGAVLRCGRPARSSSAAFSSAPRSPPSSRCGRWRAASSARRGGFPARRGPRGGTGSAACDGPVANPRAWWSRWGPASCCSSPSRSFTRRSTRRSTTSGIARRRRSSSSTSSPTSARRSRACSRRPPATTSRRR